nr:hypothetical protein [Pedobacter panaciterrae]
MKRFKKIMRLLGLIVMIILASFGIGLGGTPPVIPVTRTKHPTEFVETEEEDNDEEDVQKLK